MKILRMQVADQEIIKDKFDQLKGEVVKVGSKVLFYINFSCSELQMGYN